MAQNFKVCTNAVNNVRRQNKYNTPYDLFQTEDTIEQDVT